MKTLWCAVSSLILLAGNAAAQCDTGTLLPADGQQSDSFGRAVSLWGDRALVTSVFDDGIGADSGSAYIFERQGGIWSLARKLVASDEADSDRFGHDGAIHDDTAIVATRYDQDAGYGTGAVYVFERQGGLWAETAKLVASPMQSGAFFGQAVDIGVDEIVVGASLEDGFIFPNKGAVHVFRLLAGVWTGTQTLFASDASANARFGEDLAMDGGTLVVGARSESEKAPSAGAAYVYESIGGVWTETQKLTAGDPESGALFGVYVAVSGDVIAVGAPQEDALGTDTGAVYVFEREGSSWVQTAKLLPDTSTPSSFGFVELSGNTLLVGASRDPALGVASGAVYRFTKQAGSWIRAGKFSGDGTTDTDQFGNAISMWGTETLISARAAMDPNGFRTGKAYLFDTLNAVIPYGSGTQGSLGFVPTLTVRGCGAPGGMLDVDVATAVPGSMALMLFGLDQVALNAVGCTLLTFPLLPSQFSLPLDGAGSASFSGQLPPGLVGPLTLNMQAFVVDPGGPAGFSSTAGVSLLID